jgi:hypothetical protein
MLRIPRCYDSHLHFFGTGEVLSTLDLRATRNPEDIRALKILPEHFRGEWLVGFGWDQNQWPIDQKPHRKYLDTLFPKIPVCFVRADGHTVWVNSEALNRAGIHTQSTEVAGGRFERDAAGDLTGILVDSAKELVDNILPPATKTEMKGFAQKALRLFNTQGFTHLRDMTSDRQQFEVLHELDINKELTAYIELNFFCRNMSEFENQLSLLKELSASPESMGSHLRLGGIKIFFDGALGSEGALLSQCYCNTQNRGLTLWSLNNVETIVKKSWNAGFPVAIHTIGDEAVHQIASSVLSLKRQGLRGELHLEHVELLRTETLELLTELKPICHLQPCHWISDHHWLETKVGALSKLAFPWAALEKRQVPFYFGSDSPIEKPSLAMTAQALRESAKLGIAALKGDWQQRHSHPEVNWGSECETIWTDDRVEKVIFDGHPL